MGCQQKSDDFDEDALQPDVADYEFDRYFRWDYTRGTIEINELASPADQHRAAATIKLYKLNEGHPSLRKRELRKRAQGPQDLLDDLGCRNFIESP